MHPGFSALIGFEDPNLKFSLNVSARFLAFEAKNTNILTSGRLKINRLLKVSTMRPRVRLQQPASNSVGGGLPLCLSGIGLHPPVQILNWHCHRMGRLMQISRQNSTRGPEISFSLEDSINFRDSRLCEIQLTGGRARDERLEERPRIALALQMAELDRRREAIRKQRSNREFLNFVDERRAFVEGNSGRPYSSVMLAVMQDPSIQAEFDEVLQHQCCAKAA